MKPDEYLRMLEDRIKECQYNMDVTYRAYTAEAAKLKAAEDALKMYEQLLREG